MRYSLALVAVLLLAALCACQDKPKTSDKDLIQVNDKELVAMIEKAEAKKHVLVILDPRPAARYAQGHIPGAINIPLPEIRQGDARLAKARQIVVYGSGWLDAMSPAACKRLLALGYVNVFDFRGGLELWKEAGREVATASAPADAPAPTPAAAPAKP